MCGLLGHISTQNNTDKDRFLSALNTMTHRGPDGFGVYHNEYLSFGHRRLSVIDLSTSANQPLVFEDNKLAIIFNGEIYNYNEISADLNLETKSDTEVLVKGYAKYGTSFFSKIRGIYAFAIMDQRQNEEPICLLLRDPAGVKPFYYFKTKNEITFASEIKAILPLIPKPLEINEEAIKEYIHLGYCAEPNTAYKNIMALTPGVLYTFNCKTAMFNTTTILTYSFKQHNSNSNTVLQQTESLLKTAIKRNLVADVKVNVALSGGIDSSLVYAYANQVSNNNITGITIAFDDIDYDESPAAAAHAQHLGAPHQIEKIDVNNKLDLLNNLLLNFDQPYADSSLIPFYFLTKAAAKHSKVLIGGDSGDEIHNGYLGHRYLPLLAKLVTLKIGKLLRPIIKLAATFNKGSRKRELNKLSGLLATNTVEELLFYWESWFPPDKAMYPENPFSYNPLELVKIQVNNLTSSEKIVSNYFVQRMQSDYLRKSDMMSMYNSLEFRVPMLDEDLTQYSLSIPYKFKSNCNTNKLILRHLHSKLYPKTLSKLPKKGFTIPLDNWLGEDNINTIKTYLLKTDCYYTKFIKQAYVKTLFNSLNNPNANQYISRASIYQRILIVYSLEIWYESIKKEIIAQSN
jgi:asparagine synthase (glutamine-hydrolysing)